MDTAKVETKPYIENTASLEEKVKSQRELLLEQIIQTYSPEEQMAYAHVRNVIGIQPFKYLDTEPVVAQKIRTQRQKIIEDAFKVVLEIRKGTKTMDDLWKDLEPHFGDFEYRFLVLDDYPGINVRGTGMLIALADPVTYGTKIEAYSTVRGNISNRSAKK